MVSILLSLNFFSCTKQSTENTKPNIVIIYTDDQGYGDVSALNPEAKFKTPNIDKIADEKGLSYFFWMLAIVSLSVAFISLVMSPVIKKLMHGVR